MVAHVTVSLAEDRRDVLFAIHNVSYSVRQSISNLGTPHPSAPKTHFVLSADSAISALREIPRGLVRLDGDARERLLFRHDQKKSQLVESKKQIAGVDARMRLTGLSLYPFQVVGAEYLASRDRALLCDQMGLGKSVQALAALPTSASAIIVCPAVVKGSWLAEIKKWRPDLVASSPDKLTRWPHPGEVLIINPERLSMPPGSPSHLVTLVADEAHVFKNKKSRRHQAFVELRKTVMRADGRTWLLTATPLLNRPLELCALLEAGDLMGLSFGHFGRFYSMFQAKKGQWGTEWGAPTPDVADTLRKVMIRRLREDVLPELPTKIYRRIFIPKDPVTDQLCERMLEVVGGFRGLEKMITDNSAVEFGEISSLRTRLATAKIPALRALVESYVEQEEPLVVFSDHLAPPEAVANEYGFGRVTGSESATARTATVEKFQAGKLPGVAATIAAGGVGITLTRAAQVAFVDRSWVPALNAQAEDRVCRIGQTRGVVVTSLLCDHALDLRVEEVVTEKTRLINHAIDGNSL